MKVRVATLAWLGGIALLCGGLVEADLITYTNRTAWENAVNQQFAANFNNFEVQTSFRDSTLDVGPFTLRQVGPGSPDGNYIDVGPFPDRAPFQTPNAKLFVDVVSESSVEMHMKNPFSAWGGDFAEFDGGAAILNLLPNGGGAPATVAVPRVNGFFGFTDNLMLYNAINFAGAQIADPTFRIDNVAAGVSATTPEPATMCLFGLGILGMAVCYRRGKRQNASAVESSQP